MVDRLVYFIVRVLVCVLQTLSLESCESLARGLAWLAYDLLRIRRRITDENLRYAYPQLSDVERSRIARRMWRHLTLMFCEVVQVPRKIHPTNWRDYIHIPRDDMRVMVENLLSPRPVVIVSGHFGNFEVGGVGSGLLGFPTFTVARPLDNPYLHRFVTSFRERTGQFMLPKRGSARQLDAVLASGGTMVLLGDQAAGPKDCWVEFFGRPASCHKAVALFSLVNRAPMLLVYSKRVRPMQFEIGVNAVFDPLRDEMNGVKPLTQWYSDHLERMIRTAPDQYWWLHDRWKARSGDKQAARRAARKTAVAPVPSQAAASPPAADPPADTTTATRVDPPTAGSVVPSPHAATEENRSRADAGGPPSSARKADSSPNDHGNG
jgi:KDO2-lipid IV(A) lauroyltransferase